MLKGRVAFITGATRGIGKALALSLAREGVKIVATGKTVEPHPKLPGTLAETKEAIEKEGGECLAVPLDVRLEEQVAAAVEKAIGCFGQVDFLINNAGALFWQPVMETPPKRFDLLFQVNVRGSYLCAYTLLPHMKEKGFGHILNMSPPIDLSLLPNKTCYFITKYGMSLLTLGLAKEVYEENIAVNSLWPVTLIESQATKHFALGTRENWRTPQILVDCVLRIFQKEPKEFTGKLLLDEDFLREEGVRDFSKYAVVKGSSPQRLFSA